MNASFIRYILFSSLFLYSFTSINFRGIEEYIWIANIMGLLLCFTFVLNLSQIKLKFNFSLVALLLLVIWNLITVFPNPEIFRYFITSALILVLAFIVYNICCTYPEAIEYIKWSFIISLFIQIWISNTNIQYTDWGTIDRHSGTIGNANLYALFINIAFIFVLQKIGKPTHFIKYILIFSIIGLVFFETVNSGSRKGIFFTLAVIIFYYLSSFYRISNINKVIFLIIGSFISFQLILFFINSQYFYRLFEGFYYNEVSIVDFHRYALAQDALRMFYEKPIFGWGADGFRYFNKIDFTYSHSNYLELLVNYGTIGFILFYSVYIWFFKLTYKLINDNKSSLVLNDKYIFIFFLIITIILDFAMVRIFERMYWIIISMYLGKFYFQEHNRYNE